MVVHKSAKAGSRSVLDLSARTKALEGVHSTLARINAMSCRQTKVKGILRGKGAGA